MDFHEWFIKEFDNKGMFKDEEDLCRSLRLMKQAWNAAKEDSKDVQQERVCGL